MKDIEIEFIMGYNEKEKMKCHLVTLAEMQGKDMKKPDYCQRNPGDWCTCCPQCCTCGG